MAMTIPFIPVLPVADATFRQPIASGRREGWGLGRQQRLPTGIIAGGVSSKGPYLILPNRGMTPVAQVGFT
jgi:hypothetical protein